MVEGALTETFVDVWPFSQGTIASGSLLGTCWKAQHLKKGHTESSNG